MTLHDSKNDSGGQSPPFLAEEEMTCQRLSKFLLKKYI
jgi:hypothetical protein